MVRNTRTKSERRYVYSIIQNLSMKRLTDQEIVDYLHDEKQIEIGRSTVTWARLRMEKEAGKWYSELKQSQHRYIAAYKARVDSLLSYQKTLHEIIASTKKDEVKIRAISELHSIEMDIFNLWKQLPNLDMVDTKSSGDLNTSISQNQSTETETVDDIMDFHGHEHEPDNPWHSYVQCSGCGRWWRNQQLLDYHRTRATNPDCNGALLNPT